MLCIGKTPVNLHLKNPSGKIRAKPVLEVSQSKDTSRSGSGTMQGILLPASVNTDAGNSGLEATRGNATLDQKKSRGGGRNVPSVNEICPV